MSESHVIEVFREFCMCDEFTDIIKCFKQLQQVVGAEKERPQDIYRKVKACVNCPEAFRFFSLIDKRKQNEVYGKGTIGKDATVLVIGAGPCGLRSAVECALLGLRVVVVERRNYVSRNNVLYLWHSAVNDLKAIGAKVFYPKFCTGSLHHVSIRRLQLILLKTALLLGVEIYTPATFEELLEPNPKTGASWQARINPADCPANKIDFSVVIGADSKMNALDFPRTFTRGKVSIAITANFKNPDCGLHTRVEEIPGVIRIRNPELFDKLRTETGLEFENFLYFRDETHYFIMTAKKKSLIDEGIVKKESADLHAMFRPSNMNEAKLLNVVLKAAKTAWHVYNPTMTELPELEFEINRQGKEDVAVFDFAALHQAKHACMVKERNNKKILTCVVGDTLLEPFWPSGSGIAKGFLGVLDAVWTVRNWLIGEKTDLEVIAERESIFRILPQITPNNLSKKVDSCTIDPRTRYIGTSVGAQLPLDTVKPKDVQHLYNKTDAVKRKGGVITVQEIPKEKRPLYRGGSINTHHMVSWFKDRLLPYKDICQVTDLTKSWNDGLALCALIHSIRSDLIDLKSLDTNDIIGNIKQAFQIIEREFGIEQMMDAEDLANNVDPDRLTMMSYLFHVYEYANNKEASEHEDTQNYFKSGASTAYTLIKRVADSKALLNTCIYHNGQSGTLSRKAGSMSHYSKKRGTSLGRKKSLIMQGIQRAKTVVYSQNKSTIQNMKQEMGRMHSSSVQQGLGSICNKENTLSNEQQGCQLSYSQQMQIEESADKYKSLAHQACKGIVSARLDAFTNLEDKLLQRKGAFRNSGGSMVVSSVSTGRKRGTCEICCICEERLYIIERHCIEGYFLHRECFKCKICNTNLQIGNSVIIKDNGGKPEFYCYAHAASGDICDTSRKESYENTLTQTDGTSDIDIYGPLNENELQYFDSGSSYDDTDDEEEEDYEHLYDTLKHFTEEDTEIDPASIFDVTDTSTQLLEQDKIQQEFDDLEDERHQLETKGIQLEQQLRGSGGFSNTSDAHLDSWLNISLQKREIQEKESLLMLKMRLMALKEYLKQMLSTLQYDNSAVDDGFEAEVSKMEEVVDSVEQSAVKQDITEMVDAIKQMKLYIDNQQLRQVCSAV